MTDKQENPPKSSTLSVELQMPLNTPGGIVKTLTFRRGKAKDMLAAQRIEPEDLASRELVLMAMLTEEKVTPEDLEELDLADMAEVQAVFQNLFVHPARRSNAVGREGSVG